MAKRELTSILLDPKSKAAPQNTRMLSAEFGLDPEVVNKIVEISNRSRINILSDQPPVADSFGFDNLVRTLSNVILSENTQTPITIGIDGKWGTGKTSILRLIEAQARIQGFHCIWLNAWSLENTGSLVAAVASEVQREYRTTKRTDGKNSSTQFSKFILQIASWISSVTSALPKDTSTTILSAATEQLRQREGIVKASRDREQDIDEITDISEVASVVTTQRTFEKLVQLLLHNLNDEHSRLIVFIDDIDRALPDQIATILKNLKLILEVPSCVFVIAMDMEIVARSIEKYYRSHNQQSGTVYVQGGVRNAGTNSSIYLNPINERGEGGESFGFNYLEKLVQIRVGIPKLTRASMDSYLDELGLAPEVKGILRWTPDEEVLNPRRLKRYINWLSISLQLIISSPTVASDWNAFALRTLALRRDYPEIYGHLTGKPSRVLSSKSVGFLKRYFPNEYHVVIQDGIDRLTPSVLWRIRQDQREVNDRFDDFCRQNGAQRAYDMADEMKISLLREFLVIEPNLIEPVFGIQYYATTPESGKFEHYIEERYFKIFKLLLVAEHFSHKRSFREVSEIHEFIDYLNQMSARDLVDFEQFILQNPLFGADAKDYEQSNDRWDSNSL